MSIFTSTNICNSSNGYEGLFEHDRGTTQMVIKNNLISSEDVAKFRAISEFIKSGYSVRTIVITSIHIEGLKQNDIISFKGNNWIIKELSYNFNPPELLMTIKGVRYE